MDTSSQVNIRPCRPEDIKFIKATWLPGLYNGNDWFKKIDENVYYLSYARIVEGLLSEAEVYVASLASDPDVIVGYAVTRGHILDWVYVKKAWRKLGIGKRLIPSNITQCSHLSEVGTKLKPKTWVFNPFQ